MPLLQVKCSAFRPFPSYDFDQLKASLSSTFKPFLNQLEPLPMEIGVSKTMKNTSLKIFNTFVDSMFRFVDQPLLPSQKNFAPVEEIGEAIEVSCIEGQIMPTDFPEGIYLRNGSNPRFGGLMSSVSVFGKTNQVWVEGEGMLHALYFNKDSHGNWNLTYKNKFVRTETFDVETERNGPTFLPTVEGNSLALLVAPLLNMVRYGCPTKNYQNVNIFVHAGKLYTTSENYPAQEIEISSLEGLDTWDINGKWTGPFTSHPKVAPGSGELVTMGVSGQKPYCVVGVVSADGKEVLHKVDLKYNRSVLSHEIGVTQNYNVIIDHPLVVDVARIVKGGQLIKYDREGSSRLGAMPRYGDADSVMWFEVEPNCTFHLINCFEDGDQVTVRGCSAPTSIIPGPDWGENKFEWFSRGFEFSEENPENGYLLHRVREWKLNIITGEVKEKYLTGTKFSMDFPCINPQFTGLKHKYAYTQVIDSVESSNSGSTKYGAVAKLHFEELEGEENREGEIKVEYHKLPKCTFCTGIAFVPKKKGVEEDDGWIVTFVHNESTNLSQAYIIDAKKLESETVAVINIPKRVPYGFHGIFISMPDQIYGQ